MKNRIAVIAACLCAIIIGVSPASAEIHHDCSWFLQGLGDVSQNVHGNEGTMSCTNGSSLSGTGATGYCHDFATTAKGVKIYDHNVECNLGVGGCRAWGTLNCGGGRKLGFDGTCGLGYNGQMPRVFVDGDSVNCQIPTQNGFSLSIIADCL